MEVFQFPGNTQQEIQDLLSSALSALSADDLSVLERTAMIRSMLEEAANQLHAVDRRVDDLING